MTFFWWKALSKTFKGVQKGYLWSSSSPSIISWWGRTSWVCHKSFISPVFRYRGLRKDIVLSLLIQLIKLWLYQPLYWKQIFDQNLFIALCWLPAPNVASTSRGRWEPSLIHYEFLAKEVLACNLETSHQSHSNKSCSLIWFILCYRH